MRPRYNQITRYGDWVPVVKTNDHGKDFLVHVSSTITKKSNLVVNCFSVSKNDLKQLF